MSSFNRVIMVGNLTRDPDYKQLSSGQAVCRLSIASNRQFKNRQSGDLIQEVCYIDVDVWGAQAESCRQYLQKGRAVLVEGRLKFDSWDDTNGQKRSKHSIVADRIIFLQTGAESNAESVQNDPLDPSNPSEKQIMDQVSQIKNRIQARSTAPAFGAAKAPVARKKPAERPAPALDTSVESGEIAFVDEPPFQDDLPF